MNLLESVGVGLLLGFSLTVPPGPMNALIAARSARSYRAGVVTGIGAMSADVVLGAIVLTVSTVLDLAPIVRPVDAIGAAALLFFGTRILRSGGSASAVPVDDARTFGQALLVGFTNPFQIVWWLTAGLAVARFGGVGLLVALFGAVAIWVVAFPYAVHRGVSGSARRTRAIVVGSGAIMLAFAAYFAFLAAR